MSPPAPPEERAARARSSGTAVRVTLTAAGGGAAAFVAVVLACALLATTAGLVGGEGRLGTWARGGIAVSVLSLRSEVTATIPGLRGVGGGGHSVEASIVFVPMLVTIAFAWLCGRAGRRAAVRRGAAGVLPTVVLAAAGAAAAVAVLAAVAAAALRLSDPSLPLRLVGNPIGAAVGGGIVAAIAAAVGAFLRLSGESTAGRVLRGGLVGYGWALLLLTIGVVAIAALEPRVTRAYLDAVGGLEPVAPALVGLHVLWLPAQSALLWAPAVGTCLDVIVGEPALTLCPWRLEPQGAGFALIAGEMALSPWLWALSAVPVVAGFLGGRRTALAVAGGRAIALGGASGLVLGALSVLGVWFAAPRAVSVARDLALLPFAIETDAARLFLLATTWAVIGGGIGGWVEARTVRERS